MNQLKYPYAKQSINDLDEKAVMEALRSPAITRGFFVESFEREVADFCGARFAVSFNSGSTALSAAFFAAEANPYDRVLTTPNTFVATLSGACQKGAAPVFVDIDRKSGNIDVEKLSYNLHTTSTRGKNIIVPVHFAGIPVDMRLLESHIKDLNTVVIEDAAHAIGSKYKDGTRVGSCEHSHITCFSFHPAKTITTAEGGMCTTNDESLYQKLLYYRNNGIERDPSLFKEAERGPWVYEVNYLSGNYFMNELQAALGRSQFSRIESFIAKRKELVKRYRDNLSGKEHLAFFEPEEGVDVAWHLFVCQIDFASAQRERAQVMEELKELGIGTQVHYIPLYRHPFFRKGGRDIREYFPEAEMYYSQALTLPLYYDLTLQDVDEISSALLSTIKPK